MDNNIIYDLIIIGCGPAGLTSAIYSGRAGLKTLLIGGIMVGGQAVITEKIENYMGFPNGVSGYRLMSDAYTQAINCGANIINVSVVKVELNKSVKEIFCDDGNVYCSKSVIVATGAKNRRLGVDGEEKFIGRGVSYCATCDGGFFKNKVVAVVGGGDTAVTDALYLSKIASKVYIIHRRDKFRATQVLVNRMSEAKIEVILDSVVTSIDGDNKVSNITVYDKVKSQSKNIKIDGLFIAVGTIPDNELFVGMLELDKNGYIITDSMMRTNVDGVYAVGDVRNSPLKQIITACADGAIAVQNLI